MAVNWDNTSTFDPAVQNMATDGVNSAAILLAAAWSDENVVKRYIRRQSALEGGMALLFAERQGSAREP